MEYVKKTITVTDKQQKFIEIRSLNLSRFVQKILEEKMEATEAMEKRCGKLKE